jgi:hypothetical protein
MNKKITVYLTMEDIPVDLRDDVCYTVKDFDLAIKNKQDFIYTTQTKAISSYYYQDGYEIEVVSEGDRVTASRLLGYDDNGSLSFGREIRLSHNWEKMLRSGCFNIKYDWGRDDD